MPKEIKSKRLDFELESLKIYALGTPENSSDVQFTRSVFDEYTMLTELSKTISYPGLNSSFGDEGSVPNDSENEKDEEDAEDAEDAEDEEDAEDAEAVKDIIDGHSDGSTNSSDKDLIIDNCIQSFVNIVIGLITILFRDLCYTSTGSMLICVDSTKIEINKIQFYLKDIITCNICKLYANVKNDNIQYSYLPISWIESIDTCDFLIITLKTYDQKSKRSQRADIHPNTTRKYGCL